MKPLNTSKEPKKGSRKWVEKLVAGWQVNIGGNAVYAFVLFSRYVDYSSASLRIECNQCAMTPMKTINTRLAWASTEGRCRFWCGCRCVRRARHRKTDERLVRRDKEKRNMRFLFAYAHLIRQKRDFSFWQPARTRKKKTDIFPRVSRWIVIFCHFPIEKSWKGTPNV